MNNSDTNLENQNAEIKNSKKSNKGLIVILILIILGLSCYICYDKVIMKEDSNKVVEKEEAQNDSLENEDASEEDTENDSDNSEVKNEPENNDVPIEDTYAYGFSTSHGGNGLYTWIEFYLLENGKLYYKNIEKIKEDEEWIGDYFFTFDGYEYSSVDKTLIEVKGIDNIKRIKGTNSRSTGVGFNILLITEKGEVYDYDAGDKEATRVKLLENYLVEDIIEFNSVNGCLDVDWTEEYGCGGSFKIILKNGQIIEKSY